MPLQSIKELETYTGTEDLFTDLMQCFGGYSGISGIQPKALVRDSEAVADVELAAQVQLLIVQRFDLNDKGGYLGV